MQRNVGFFKFSWKVLDFLRAKLESTRYAYQISSLFSFPSRPEPKQSGRSLVHSSLKIRHLYKAAFYIALFYRSAHPLTRNRSQKTSLPKNITPEKHRADLLAAISNWDLKDWGFFSKLPRFTGPKPALFSLCLKKPEAKTPRVWLHSPKTRLLADSYPIIRDFKVAILTKILTKFALRRRT